MELHEVGVKSEGQVAKCKYKLRSVRRGEEGEDGPRKRGPKPRLRSAGMSRYRRKEANARERQRQGEINTGFDKLREKIPHPGPSNGKCEKLRKIDILHVAINYIRALENILDTGEVGIHEFANSVYAVASSEGSRESVEEGSSDSSCSDGGSYEGGEGEKEEVARRESNNMHYTFFQGRQTSPSSPRRITLPPRDTHKAAVPLHFTQPPDTKPFRPFPTYTSTASIASFSPSPKPALYQMNLNCKIYPTSLKMEIPECLNQIPRGQQMLPDLSIEEFSDMSSSDPEDLFTDIHSSLESLNHFDAFSFFSEKHPLPAFTI